MITSITSLTAFALLSSVAQMPMAPVTDTAPRLVTSCDSPLQASWQAKQASLDDDGSVNAFNYAENGRVSLVMSGTSYRLRFESGMNEKSNVFKVEGIQLDEHSFHIIRDDGQGAPEHFLFNLGLDGSGELLWSSAEGSVMTACSGVL